jgi:isochorismate synthase
LPFDQNIPANLIFPESVRWAAPPSGKIEETSALPSVTAVNLRSVPDRASYLNIVGKAIARIRDTKLEKVVLARSLELTASSQIDVALVLRNLVRQNRGAYTFGLDISEGHRSSRIKNTSSSRGGHTLIGASPELLVSRSKLDVIANPLAGSAARSVDQVEDRRRACALLGSQKDRLEHAFVVDAVVNALRPLCAKLQVPRKPSLLQTATMWHLSTKVRGRLHDPSICALRLATVLHPTPAVCGTPRDEAMSVIRELEGFNRGFYAGFVGWSDATGDGEWVVSIRCGEIEDRRIRIFAGAGIVDGSRPDDEFAETSVKLQTLLTALGVQT